MTTAKCSRRHFLKADYSKKWTEVTKEQWLDAEREAGFHSTTGSEYATGGFGGGGISGRYSDDGSSHMTTAKCFKIEILSIHEISFAYEKAIERYCNERGEEEETGDVWDGKIVLKQINFERNFRRASYECVFEISEGGT